MSAVLPERPFDLFFGTGGVGKTTLATARALQLVGEGKRVLLMTIDPAKRLKDLLGLREEDAGEVVAVNGLAGMPPFPVPLHALLMSAPHTMARMARSAGVEELSRNRIISILARPNGGMNEILALVELQMRLEEGPYDCVVLDTPPGTHFLDFLEGLEKIRAFFDQRFVEIFASLGRKSGERGFAVKLVGKVVNAGVHKLLSYLQKVTGEKFVEDFLEALEVIYRARGAFTKGLALEKRLTDHGGANWFLVTSVEQGKAGEALEIQREARKLAPDGLILALNKCLAGELAGWKPAEGSPADRLRHALLDKEAMLKERTRGGFNALLEFPEVLAASPVDHVRALTETWRRHAVRR